ncbi:MAG: sigma 54-dependent Fis family transcriptional regulator [Myxococcus sp.]|nr:sigma 54-dependent Fis family transcriptional regulator [Myxococcus sp.]
MSDPRTETLDQTAAPFRPLPVRLLVLAGPDLGKEFIVEQGTALVGSHQDCQLQLSDTAVSRRHLSIELMGVRARVRDLSSKNGTRFQGAKLTVLDLPLGSVVELGSTQLAVLPKVSATATPRDSLGPLLGRSDAMRRLFSQLEQVGPTDASVLLHGETGTGKEACARAMHGLSPRAAEPFVTFDCGAATGELVQATLFGHVKGAFTGAVKDSGGVVEAANGGTLMLDEVASLPLELQPLLLRVLETGSYQRVGDTKLRSSDFRLVATTQHDLTARVKAGVFRADLYYRLSAIVLEVPPLKHRLEDVAPLAQSFARQQRADAVLSPSALAALSAWQWPGNVRELKNVVERILTLGEEAVLPRPPATGPGEDFHVARERALAAFERSYLEALLTRHQGSAAAAAREAGIARSYLYKMLEQHGVDPAKFRG